MFDCFDSFIGNLEIVELLLQQFKNRVNVNVRDINDHTPLHEAARWSDLDEEENKKRIEVY